MLAVGIAPLLLYALAAVAFTWPLAIRLQTHIPGGSAHDNVAFLWTWWWMRRALGGDDLLFETGHLFHPFGTGLAMHTHAYLGGLPVATLFSGLDIVTAANLSILLALALNGLTMFWLAFYWTRDRSASLVGGLYFSWAPFFAGHVLGHFNLIQAWPLPLFALCWLHAHTRRCRVAALAAGLVLGLVVWADYYLASYLLVFVAVTLLSRWLSVRVRPRPATRAVALDYLLVGAIALLVGAVVVIRQTGGGVFFVSGHRVSATTGLPMLTAAWIAGLALAWRRWRPRIVVRTRAEARVLLDLAFTGATAAASALVAMPILVEAWKLYRAGAYVTPPGFLRSAAEGIEPIAMLMPSPFHALWGDAMSRLYQLAVINPVESTGWIGLAALVVLVRTRLLSSIPASARLWQITAVVFLVWAMGPYLRLFGENTGLYLPAAALRLLPIVDNVRIPGRAIVVVYLSLAMLVAFALAAVPAGRRRLALLGVAGVIVADFLPAPLPLTPLGRPAVYTTLAGLPPGAVLELPIGIRDGYGEYGALDHRAIAYQTIHGHPITGGFVARMPPMLARQHLESPFFGPLLSLSASEAIAPVVGERLRTEAPAMLRAHRIAYVVVSSGAPDALRQVLTAWPLQLVAEDADRRLYRIVEVSPVVE